MLKRSAVICGLFSLAVVTAASGLPEDVRRRLASDDFKSRELAQEDLLRWATRAGPDALGTFIEAMLDERDPEVKVRGFEVLEKLAHDAYLNEEGAQGYLGVSLMNAPVPVPEHGPERVGFQIGWVTPESPAERAGVKAGDVIAGVDDQSWSGDATTAHLTAAIGGYKPGETVRLTISRDGKIEHLQAVLTRRPASLPVPNAPEAIQLQWGQFELTPQQPLEEIKRAEQSDKDRFFRKWLRENRPGR